MNPSRRCPSPVLAALLFVAFGGSRAAADDGAIRLTDAKESGAFNVGAAQAGVTRDGDAVKLDYRLPRGTAAGVWAKEFPAGFAPGAVDVVRVHILTAADQTESVAVSVEVKGTAGVQRVPVPLRNGEANAEAELNWPAVGTVREVTVVFDRTGDAEAAAGTANIDVRFERLPLLRRLSMHPATRIGAVLLAGLFAAAIVGLLQRAIGYPNRRESVPAGLRRDFVLGVGVAATALLVVWVYRLGALSPLEIGWAALGAAAAGVALWEWLKFGLTRKHLTPGEAFLSVIGTGLPAASASQLVLLQAPGSWSDALRLSATAAAGVVLAFNAANLCRVASVGRALGPALGGLIVGTPYVLGSLLLLRADALMQALGTDLSSGVLDGSGAKFVGRACVAFAFNVMAAHGLSLAATRRPLRSPFAHLPLFAVAVAVVASPWVAAFGSTERVATLPAISRTAVVLATTMLSQAGLWAAVYLVTGMVLDALSGRGPSAKLIAEHPVLGARKGAVYSGIFMAVVCVPALVWEIAPVRWLWANAPLFATTIAGAVAFPLVKTVIETFDGSTAFFRRLGRSYCDPVLYLRGVVAGLSVGGGLYYALPFHETPLRAFYGFAVGAAVFAGVNLIRDWFYESRGIGWDQPKRVYLASGLIGGAIGAALAFYLDPAQIATIAANYRAYLTVGTPPQPFNVLPVLSKWGQIYLGDTTGGPSLLFAQALSGVIEWSIPAWLFALNRTFLLAYFRKEAAPIRGLFSRDGLVGLTENMIAVFRWGLWMSPIIKSFLHPMGEPTWYNQDGAIRTVLATVQDATTSRSAFEAWSLQVFISLMAYDSIRILIWLDHFGLRVATLVNLSFLGTDKLDGWLARVLAPAATARCIPEAVKRFTTWAPLLIPYYIPRGANWDTAWSESQRLARENTGGVVSDVLALSPAQQLLLLIAAVVGFTAFFAGIRRLRHRLGWDQRPELSIRNANYEVVVTPDGGTYSRVPARNYDVTRRSYDRLDPAGRTLFAVDSASGGSWPLIGNYPAEVSEPPRVEQGEHSFTVSTERNGLRTALKIALAEGDDPAEVWTVTVENPTDAARQLKLVPYLEWVLNKPDADRGHTQYNRLFAEVEYAAGLHAVLAWDKHAKAMGVLAADVAPDGFLSSRMDFIGRARSVWEPRVLETLAYLPATDTDGHPTFDPIGSLLLPLAVPARGSVTVRFVIGLVADKKQAIELVAEHLRVPTAGAVSALRFRKQHHSIGHGEIPPDTPVPYSSFSDDGRRLAVHTPYTPRPYDHAMSNALGHFVTVTNRGLYTTSSVNSQQNRITPDWSDTVTREVPAEAFYLYDPERNEWYSPTYHPLNDPRSDYRAEFGVDGTAVYHMACGDLATELTVFVPPDEPAGVYLLTVRNRSAAPKRLRVAPYFQIVLAGQPEWSGPLKVRHDPALSALFFENPRNTYRTGPAFAAVSAPVERVAEQRGLFFGDGRGVTRPAFVESGVPDAARTEDDRSVAAFLATLDIPPGGEATFVAVLGQADDRASAEAVIRRFRNPESVRESLQATREWWLRRMDSVRVRVTDLAFAHYLDWLKYQALAERIWARRGFYQASGAFGFRDQLQDSVNLMWMDPSIARRQIVLHASQQFLEGDVVHWFHRLQDGRTGFVGRTYASDNLLWLPWGVVEYLAATGDDTILDERTPYLEAEQPFPPLPAGKHGMGFDPLRSARADGVYRHCLKAIDLVLDKRLGVHGLPLMGTGDWNDGLDEIGSEGRGESVWLGLFLYTILDRMAGVVGRREGAAREVYYRGRLRKLGEAIEWSWRGDRYLRAVHDDGTEIGVKGSGVWEIDALTAAWAVMANVNPERGRIVFDTALDVLEKENTILLGWPALREDTKPYLGRSSAYPEGVRENGMYCHGVQWLVGAARLLADRFEREGNPTDAARYRETAHRLWRKISPLAHTMPGEIEVYGGQPNKQAADMVTSFDPGRMIWHGYTGAAGWMFRQAIEGVLGFRLDRGKVVIPPGPPGVPEVTREIPRNPL